MKYSTPILFITNEKSNAFDWFNQQSESMKIFTILIFTAVLTGMVLAIIFDFQRVRKSRAVTLKIKAKHFTSANYSEKTVLANAATEYFEEDVNEDLFYLYVGRYKYRTKQGYYENEYLSDSNEAKVLGYNDAMIREIEILRFS